MQGMCIHLHNLQHMLLYFGFVCSTTCFSCGIYIFRIQLNSVCPAKKGKAVPLHATKALVGRGGIAPVNSRPRH
jgi:hypothetical protein